MFQNVFSPFWLFLLIFLFFLKFLCFRGFIKRFLQGFWSVLGFFLRVLGVFFFVFVFVFLYYF